MGVKSLARTGLFVALIAVLALVTVRVARMLSAPAETGGLPAALGGAPEQLQATPPPGTDTPTPTASPTETFAPTETATITPTPSPTPIPLFDWYGPPTYPGDSTPGILFQLRYDPGMWTLNDPLGNPFLVHAGIPGCTLAPVGGRGMPPVWRIERRTGLVGPNPFEISTASLNGVPQFTNYLGGDLRLYTAFQVRYGADVAGCLREAETVLATLHSITPEERDNLPTPTPTPTGTLTMSDTVTPPVTTPTPTATP